MYKHSVYKYKAANERQLLLLIQKLRADGTLFNKLHVGQKEYVRLDNGERMAYLKKGTGKKTLLLVHGNLASSVQYSPLLDRLPSDFTAYAPDLRGFGDSTYSEPVETLADFAEDLYSFVTKLGLRDITLVGWSTGGGVCLRFDAKYPGICKEIVLVDSVATNGYALYQHDIFGRPIEGKVYASKEEMICDPFHAMLSYNILAQNYVFMNAIWMEQIYVVHEPSPLDNYAYLTESLKQRNIIDVEWALATFNMTRNANAYGEGDGEIDKITVPVLCIRGREDRVVTEKMFRLTADSIGENAECLVLGECGHSPFVDCPDRLGDEIFAFARENSAAR